MQITPEITLKTILDKYPDAVQVFSTHGVDIPSECDESVWDTQLELCESMCHIEDFDGLIRDLQKFVDAKGSG